MKIKILLCLISVMLLMTCVSCGNQSSGALKGTDISAPSFTWNGDTATISVSSSTETFSFNEKITVDENATYILASDMECKNAVPSKTINLSFGNNTYYVLVSNGSAQKLYTFNVYRKNTCTVTFNTNGGDGIGSMKVDEGTAINDKQTSKFGYIFEGWNVYGEKITFPYKINTDVTLNAILTPIKYEIEYVLNGGVNNSDNPNTYTIEDIIYLNSPTREDYDFVGWYTNADLSGESIRGISQGTTEKITFYAKWKTAYKIEYELYGGVNNEGNLQSYVPGEEVILLDPTREGYEFLGWYTESTFRNKVDKISAGSSGGKKFYAKWDAYEYVLSFNGNGGSGIMGKISLYTDEVIDLSISLFKREGYTFIGWSTAPNGEVEYLDGASYTMAPRDTTLYAVWDENEPVDENLTIFNNGFTEYTIVYPKNNEAIESQVKELVSYIKSTYNITIEYKAVDKDEDVGEKEIIIGNVRNKVKFSTSKLENMNDFVLDVSGDDYIICAANNTLYPYAIRIFKDEILSKTSNRTLRISSDQVFNYKDSTYKDVTYLNYLKTKSGNYDKSLLCELFNGLTYTATDGTVLSYRLYVPSDYDFTKEYPVLVFLHGAGERGNDNKAQMSNMLAEMFNQQKTLIEGAIVIAPQCPGGNQWVDTPWVDGNYSIDKIKESNELKAVVELLNKIKNEFSTDEDRYYAMGISMGGFGTWDLIMRHTEMFAAAVPVCGGADVSQAENLKLMPIYTAHADNDGSVPFTGTNEMVKALKQAGSTVIVFSQRSDGTLTSGGHLIWSEIGSRKEMLEWLFSKKKSDQVLLSPEIGENGTQFVPMN